MFGKVRQVYLLVGVILVIGVVSCTGLRPLRIFARPRVVVRNCNIGVVGGVLVPALYACLACYLLCSLHCEHALNQFGDFWVEAMRVVLVSSIVHKRV